MNSNELVLVDFAGGNPGKLRTFSPFVLKVQRALHWLDLAYVSRHVGPEELLRLNPAAQVPVLLVQGKPIADSTDICRALDALAGGGRLVPLEPGARAAALLTEELADTAVNGYVVAARWADEDNWPRVRDAFFAPVPAPARAGVTGAVRERVLAALRARDVIRAGLDACWRRFGELLCALDAAAPAQGYWHGPALSVADLALFGQLFSLDSELTPRQRDLVRGRERLYRYLERVERATAR